MSGDFDPRDYDTRERDDGSYDHEEEWLTPGRGPSSGAGRDGETDDDVRSREEDWREARDREPRDRDDARGGIDPRDVFMRDNDLPRGPERERVHDRDREEGSFQRTGVLAGSRRSSIGLSSGSI